MTLQVVAEHEPRAVVFCFGPDAAVYRVELYPAYHADRPPVPDELAWQFAAAPELFDGARVEHVHDEELEADDLLYTLAAAERRAGGQALILTGDRDLFQCAGDGVRVLYLKTGVKGTELGRRGRGRAAVRDPPALVPGLHRAARRPLGRAARREGNRREDGSRAASPPRVAGGAIAEHCGSARHAFAARFATTPTSCARSRTSRRSAAPRGSAARATARPTTRAAPKAARALGMRRLADRLERLGGSWAVRREHASAAPRMWAGARERRERVQLVLGETGSRTAGGFRRDASPRPRATSRSRRRQRGVDDPRVAVAARAVDPARLLQTRRAGA